MAANARGHMRANSGNRTPPFVIVGLLVIIAILAFNYWNLSSKNVHLGTEVEEMGLKYRSTLAKKVEAERSNEGLKQRVDKHEHDLQTYKQEIQDKAYKLDEASKRESEMRAQLESLAQEMETNKNDLNMCDDEVGFCRENITRMVIAHRRELGELQNRCNTRVDQAQSEAEQRAASVESSCQQAVGEMRLVILRAVQQVFGTKAVRLLSQQAHVDISGIDLSIVSGQDVADREHQPQQNLLGQQQQFIQQTNAKQQPFQQQQTAQQQYFEQQKTGQHQPTIKEEIPKQQSDVNQPDVNQPQGTAQHQELNPNQGQEVNQPQGMAAQELNQGHDLNQTKGIAAQELNLGHDLNQPQGIAQQQELNQVQDLNQPQGMAPQELKQPQDMVQQQELNRGQGLVETQQGLNEKQGSFPQQNQQQPEVTGHKEQQQLHDQMQVPPPQVNQQQQQQQQGNISYTGTPGEDKDRSITSISGNEVQAIVNKTTEMSSSITSMNRTLMSHVNHSDQAQAPREIPGLQSGQLVAAAQHGYGQQVSTGSQAAGSEGHREVPVDQSHQVGAVQGQVIQVPQQQQDPAPAGQPNVQDTQDRDPYAVHHDDEEGDPQAAPPAVHQEEVIDRERMDSLQRQQADQEAYIAPQAGQLNQPAPVGQDDIGDRDADLKFEVNVNEEEDFAGNDVQQGDEVIDKMKQQLAQRDQEDERIEDDNIDQ